MKAGPHWGVVLLSIENICTMSERFDCHNRKKSDAWDDSMIHGMTP